MNTNKLNILIIPDSHATYGVSNRRFLWLSRFIISRQPDIIIDLGDRASMNSLSKYDTGQLSAEGRRYKDDIAVVHDSNRLIESEIIKYNNKCTKWKKKKYTPDKYVLLGNHENRINIAAKQTPSLYGHLSINDLDYWKYWNQIDFLSNLNINGINFKHYFTSGIMGRPIGGEHHAAYLVKKGYESCVCGHSHLKDYWEDTTVSGKKVFGLVCGCYFEHDEDYTTENDRYWRGLVYLHRVHDGRAEPEFIDLETIRKEYG